MTEGIENGRHLGEGVYASYDGYHIWLAANHHENKVVALEPSVMRQLVLYACALGGEMRAKTEAAR